MTRLVTILLLALMAAGSTWLLDRLDTGEARRVAGERHDPDWYMRDFTQRTMGMEGDLVRKLTADSMVHYPDDDSTELVRPRLELYNNGPRPWHVVADRGWVSGGNEVILLYGEVEIWRLQDDGEREVEVLTTDLRILPDEQYAETDNAATIRTRTTTTRAVGMRASFGVSRLELLERVTSRYDPDKDS